MIMERWMSRLALVIVLLANLSACSGIRRSRDLYTVHAEAVRLFGYGFPYDDQERAQSLIPDGATVITVSSSPSDYTSITGLFGRFLGISSTEISGLTPSPPNK